MATETLEVDHPELGKVTVTFVEGVLSTESRHRINSLIAEKSSGVTWVRTPASDEITLQAFHRSLAAPFKQIGVCGECGGVVFASASPKCSRCLRPVRNSNVVFKMGEDVNVGRLIDQFLESKIRQEDAKRMVEELEEFVRIRSKQA